MNRKPGRPPKDKTGPKQARMEIRVEQSEKETFEKAAKAAGESLSDWSRAVLLRAASRKLSK